jgi:hypothetical protein
MKTKIEQKEPDFKPITITVTFESYLEAFEFATAIATAELDETVSDKIIEFGDEILSQIEKYKVD